MYNPRLPGQYQDNDFVYYNGYRYYEPATGRYLQPEPAYQSPETVINYAFAGYPLNPYTYALNNPMRFVDVDGLLFGDLVPAGEKYGAFAAQWYADKSIRENNTWWEKIIYTVGGLLASLWTPETSDATFLTFLNGSGAAVGKEYSCNRNLRIAPWGNRGSGELIKELPHYHRRGPANPKKPTETIEGQGIGRHRPWQKKSTDTSWWDRF